MQVQDIEVFRLVAQIEQGHQHKHRAQEGVEEEFDRRIEASLGLDLEAAVAVAKAAAEGDVCDPANDNAPGQVVLSGATAAIERAMKLAPEMGARRALPLPVSAPFHCAMMAPAAEAMAEALATTSIEVPVVPVVANVTASAVNDPPVAAGLEENAR